MNMEFFAYWNGEQMHALFRILAMMTSTGDFLSLLRFGALLGFLCVLTVGALHYRGMDAMSFLLAVLIFYCALLVPKMTVSIRDDRAGTVAVVEHVPLGIGVLSCSASQIGHWLTETFESQFTQVDAERFSRFGAVFPQRAVTLIEQIGPITPQGRRLIGDFNRYCVVPELIDRSEKLEQISQSPDLWATISAPGWLNPARRTLSSQDSWIGCDAALNDIDRYLTGVEIPALEKHLAMSLLPDRVDASAAVRQALPQSEALLLGISRTLAQSIRHTVMLNSVTEGVKSVAAAAGHPLALSSALAHAQGNLAGEINYRTMAKIAQEALPKVRNSLEFVILGCFPLLFVMIIASGHRAGVIFRSYVTLLLWLQLWAPVSAVINYLIITVDANPLSRIMAEYGGDTMLAVDLIREYGTSSQAIAGYLLMLAPVIAFAIAKGSDIATAQMVGSVMAPAQSAAQSHGAALAGGNVSLGNASLGNVNTNNQTGNTHRRFADFADPSQVQSANAYGSAIRTQEGLVTGAASSKIALGVTPSVNVSQSDSSSQTSALQAQTGYRQTDGYTQTQQASEHLQLSAGFASQLNQTLSQTSSAAQTDQSQLSQSASQSMQTSLQHSRGFAHSQSGQIVSHLGAGIGFGRAEASSSGAETISSTPPAIPGNTLTSIASDKPLNSSFALKTVPQLGSQLSVNHAQRLADTATSSDAGIDNQTRTQAYSQLMSAARTIAADTRDSGTREAAQTFAADLTRAYQQVNQIALQRSAQAQASQQSGFVSNQDIRTLMDNHPQALQSAVDTFGSIERAQSILFHSASARRGFALKLQNEQAGQTDALHSAPSSLETIDRTGAAHAERFNREIQPNLQENQSAVKSHAYAAQDAAGRAPGSLPDRSSTDELIESVRIGTQTQQMRRHQSMNLQRGASAAADALYKDEQSGLSATFGNAFGGALTYQSPQAYAQALLKRAHTDLALEHTLSEVGQTMQPIDRAALERRYQYHRQHINRTDQSS